VIKAHCIGPLAPVYGREAARYLDEVVDLKSDQRQSCSSIVSLVGGLVCSHGLSVSAGEDTPPHGSYQQTMFGSGIVRLRCRICNINEECSVALYAHMYSIDDEVVARNESLKFTRTLPEYPTDSGEPSRGLHTSHTISFPHHLSTSSIISYRSSYFNPAHRTHDRHQLLPQLTGVDCQDTHRGSSS